MKIAVIGSRMLDGINIEEYIPSGVSEIISGGAKGIDSLAREFAKSHDIVLTEILPDYKKYGRAAPLVRNKQIVELSDMVLAFWDGKSKGTLFVINYAKKVNKRCEVIQF